jgi:hypothetical protein
MVLVNHRARAQTVNGGSRLCGEPRRRNERICESRIEGQSRNRSYRRREIALGRSYEATAIAAALIMGRE